MLKSIIFSDQEMKQILETMNKEIGKRLDSLEDTMTQQNTTGECPMETTGSFLNPADNCSHILHHHPQATSGITLFIAHRTSEQNSQILVYTGYYWLQSSPGYAVKVFCDMERVCGCDGGRGEGGGWMRVANINMTRPNETCPAGFRKVTDSSGKTMCGGQGSSCSSTTFSSHGLQYSRVCGKIIGYQYNSPEAFAAQTQSIDDVFVDGIVLTHGSPQIHIWTFAAGITQYGNDQYRCPCNGGSYSGTVPPYIGNDYFCDSGFHHSTGVSSTY